MIRGAEQGFKFTSSFDFDDIDTIVAVFSQSNNNGTSTAPMPITKYYNRAVTMVDTWNDAGKDISVTYGVGKKYYKYNTASSSFVASSMQPTETDVSGGAATTWPLSGTPEISKVYKCDQSYYQYNPATEKWDITAAAPTTAFITLSTPGVANIPSSTDKKRICIYNQRYYRHNGTEWEESTDDILSITEVDYWDHNNEGGYGTNTIYCAKETYYKYIDGKWCAYDSDCMECTEVAVWDSDDESGYDKSKIYKFKELYYQYNALTEAFEKTGVHEIYYRYDADEEQWEQCEVPDAHLEEIDLWLTDKESEKNVKNTYVCKNVYYRYDATKTKWEASKNISIPVVEISEWKTDDTVTYDADKIYTCRARYYKYSVTDSVWEELAEYNQPSIIKLDYWKEPTNRDQSMIYLCGKTYFQYNSSKTQWQSSDVCDIEPIKIDDPSEATDSTKIYECCPLYYKYDNGQWSAYTRAVDAVRNDGFAPVDGDSKSFVSMLSAEETLRFSEKYKGCVQVTVYSATVNRTDKSQTEYFTVYPTTTNDTFSNIPSAGDAPMVVLDAGEII